MQGGKENEATVKTLITSMMLMLRPDLVGDGYGSLPPATDPLAARLVPNYPLRGGGAGYVGHPALADPEFARATTEVILDEAMVLVDGLLDARSAPVAGPRSARSPSSPSSGRRRALARARDPGVGDARPGAVVSTSRRGARGINSGWRARARNALNRDLTALEAAVERGAHGRGGPRRRWAWARLLRQQRHRGGRPRARE
jgi:hypothetical protein